MIGPLEHYGDRQLVQLFPQLVEGLVVRGVQLVEHPLALLLLARRRDDHAGQQLPRFDLRVISVLEHLGSLDRGTRQAPAHFLVELLPDAVKLCPFHDHASEREFRV
jgi:hypothetical protein